MGKITIKQITMDNFKGEIHRITKFKDNVTVLSGRNGSGKSRHMDAFLWCLFGKDSMERKDYEVKTYVRDSLKSSEDVSVEVKLLIDGERETTYKRVLHEKYSQDRGNDTLVFKGNETLCYIDDVPVKSSEYRQAVNELVSEDLFKLVTNPTYFVSLKWDIQRSMLFSLLDDIPQSDIIAYEPRLEQMREPLTKYTLGQYKDLTASEKKKVKADLTAVTPKLEQTVWLYELVKRGANSAKAMDILMNEINALSNWSKKLSQKMADIEKAEYLIGLYYQTWAKMAEQKINGKFKSVKFRLFESTVEGKINEVCIPTLKAVPYGSVNTAGKLLMGMDIIDTFSKHYDTYAPIWIDNVEGINQVPTSESQQIHMVVTKSDFKAI